MTITKGGEGLMEVQSMKASYILHKEVHCLKGDSDVLKMHIVNTRETTHTQRPIVISEDKYRMLKIHPKKIEKKQRR